MDLYKIFHYALQREYEGKAFFEQNARRMSHATAVEVFNKLAEEEAKHIRFIQAQIDALENRPVQDTADILAMANQGFFSQRAQSELIDQTIAEAMVPDLPVLRMAYLIERDFADFYEMAAGKTSGNAQEVLQLLANWERGHERLFKQLHDNAFELYAEMPWGG